MNELRWSIVGFAFGLSMAYFKWQSLSLPPVDRAALPAEEFERLLGGTLVDRPQIDHLTIHPTATGYRVDGTAWEFYDLTLRQAAVSVMVPAIFRPSIKNGPAVTDLPFLDYMRRCSGKFSWVHYRYIWWEEPAWLFGGYATCGLFIGAILWPLALRLIAGSPAFEERDQGNGDASHSDSSTSADSPTPSVTDHDELTLMKVLEAAEANLKIAGDPQSGTSAAHLAVERHKHLVPEQVHPNSHEETPAELKHFRGDFYPTELHGHESETPDI
jgi:hypothetical protein